MGGCLLTPEFDRDTLSYTAVLTHATDSVDITAAPCDAAASVSGTGVHALQTGLNTFNITVTAPSGDSVVYTLNLSRQAAEGDAAPPPPAETPVPTAPPAETPPPPPAQQKGDADAAGTVGINDLIRTRNHILGTAALSGEALTAADVDADGTVGINDLIRIRNHILGTAPIT